MRLHKIPVLRPVVLGLLRHLPLREIRIRHHWTGKPFHLHPFQHKGYWYHGRAREAAVMAFYGKNLRPGATVIEVGGHIGYQAQYFAELIGAEGQLWVFEPSEQNRAWLERNLADYPQAEIVPQAVTDHTGEVTFFTENLTGQNNSIVEDYEVLAANARRAGVTEASLHRERVTVPCTTLDDFLMEKKTECLGLIKIDVEGAELQALRGMTRTLRTHRPLLMVEISREADGVFALLREAGYRLESGAGEMLTAPPTEMVNVFGLPAEL